MCAVEQSTVFLGTLVNFDDLGTSEELHDHTTGNNGGDTEFHESTSVGCKDNTHPVERITSNSLGNTVKGHLTADQVDKEDNSSPHSSGLERNELMMGKYFFMRVKTRYLFVGLVDFGEESHNRSHEAEKLELAGRTFSHNAM